jgi:lipoprotein NlpD
VTGKARRPFRNAEAKDGAHEGIDLLSPLGTAVRASAAGKVIFAGQGPEAYGLTVIIFHGGRWTTTYSFLQKVTVKEGEEVKTGERVGLVGDTGLAEEPQLHFEVRRNRVPLDPAKYLPRR